MKPGKGVSVRKKIGPGQVADVGWIDPTRHLSISSELHILCADFPKVIPNITSHYEYAETG